MNINFDGWYIASLVFGVLAVLVCLLVYAFPSRKLTLIFKMLFDIFSIFNLAFAYISTKEVGLLAGLGTNVVGVTRDIFFLFRKKYKWADHYFWLIFFCSLYALSLIFTYKSALSLMPVIASIINTSALYLINQKRTKIITIFGQIIFITYFAILIQGSELLTILNLAASTTTLISVIIGLFLILKNERKEKLE